MMLTTKLTKKQIDRWFGHEREKKIKTAGGITRKVAAELASDTTLSVKQINTQRALHKETADKLKKSYQERALNSYSMKEDKMRVSQNRQKEPMAGLLQWKQSSQIVDIAPDQCSKLTQEEPCLNCRLIIDDICVI